MDMFNADLQTKCRPERQFMSGKIFVMENSIALISITSLLLFTTTPTGVCSPSRVSRSTNNVDANGQRGPILGEPLVYQRLRFDQDYLQLFRRYQHYHLFEEKKFKLKINESESGDEGKTREREIVYYENDQIDAKKITHDKVIFDALDRTYLTRLVPAHVFDYNDREDLRRASDPKLISEKRCQRDLNFMLCQLDLIERSRSDPKFAQQLSMTSGMSQETLTMFDSFGTEESGLMLGNHLWSGNWRQCHKRLMFNLDRQNKSKSFDFRARYCIASLRSPSWDKEIEERIVELKKAKHFKYPEQEYDYANFFRIQVGICLPESCDSRIVEKRRNDIHRLTVLKLSQPYRSFDLKSLYCLPDETSELRQVPLSGKLFLCAIAAWCLLIAVCTYYDHYYCETAQLTRPSSSKLKLISAMSLKQNFERLTETKSCQSPQAMTKMAISTTNETRQQTQMKLYPNDLLFLNSIKVLIMPLIIFGHVGMIFKQLDRNALDYDALNSDAIFNFQASTPLLVDWFFVISSFLTTYLMFATKRVEKNTWLQWVYTIFHRYWRLAPLYTLHFWFAQNLFVYTGHGPVWDYGTTNMTMRSICKRESLLWPITLTSNLHPLHEECIMPAWYISCDMQFYMCAPLILILLYKSPLMGWLTCVGGIGACIALRVHKYWTDPRSHLLELMRPRYDLYMRNNWDMHATYVYPQYRIASYLMGILAGHYVYMVLSGQWTSVIYIRQSTVAGIQDGKRKWSSNSGQSFGKFLRFVTWLTGLVTITSLMFAAWIISEGFPHDRLERQIKYFGTYFYTTHHSSAAIGMSLMLTGFMFGQFPKLKQFLSHPYWTVLSRVNFIVYLTQVEWIYWLMQSSERTIEMSQLELHKIFLYLCCFIYTISTVLTLLFELPLATLEKHFIGAALMGGGGKQLDSKSRQQQVCYV